MACPGNTVPSVLILHTSQIEAEQSQFEYLKLTPACAWLNQNIYFRPRKENELCSKSTVYTMLFGSSHALVMSRNNAQLKKNVLCSAPTRRYDEWIESETIYASWKNVENEKFMCTAGWPGLSFSADTL